MEGVLPSGEIAAQSGIYDDSLRSANSLYARLLSYLGDKTFAVEARAKAGAQREALRAARAGRWFTL